MHHQNVTVCIFRKPDITRIVWMTCSGLHVDVPFDDAEKWTNIGSLWISCHFNRIFNRLFFLDSKTVSFGEASLEFDDSDVIKGINAH